MFGFLGRRGVAILGLVVGVASAVANAPEAVGNGAADVAQHVGGFIGLLLAAAGGSAFKKNGGQQ